MQAVRRVCLSVLLALTAVWVACGARAVTFDVSFLDNGTGDFASRGWLDSASPFQQNIQAGLDIWGKTLASTATLTLRVSADNSVARAGGTFSNSRFLGFHSSGNAIFEPAPLSVVNTGSNSNGPIDMFILFNSAYVEANYWFDPTPGDRNDEIVPDGKTDFVSIVLHETMHALGVAGPRNPVDGLDYGTFPGFMNPFDVLSFFGGDGNPLDAEGNPNPMFFSGLNASEIFGGPVPLSHVGPDDTLHSQDFYHLGTCGDPLILTTSLMNGCAVPVGSQPRLQITELDKAVMADLGFELAAEALPEPGSVLLFGVGLAAIGSISRRPARRGRKLARLDRSR